VRRGDLVTTALVGDYGKPRPALVIQSNLFDAHPSVTILPVTSDLREVPLFRVRLEPSAENGLLHAADVMVDKSTTVAREKIGRRIGRLDDSEMVAVNRLLAVFLGIA
jgi:mRNA interferase MazF